MATGQHVLEIKDFQTADFFDAPNQTQIKSLLKGARARPLEHDFVLVYEVELGTFQKTGERELIIRAPECLYDQRNDTASSSGPLHVQTADGKFSIEGEGFLWQKTNSFLLISNKVHTVVQPELMNAQNTQPGKSGREGPIEIFSRTFDYRQDSGLGVYRENVRVEGTNLSLVSRQLTLHVPVAESRKAAHLESITAMHDVGMVYTGIQATGQLAVYTAATGLAAMTGSPSWRVDQREGRGEELVVDRTNRIFRANGNAWMRLPGRSLGASGFLSSSNVATAHTSATTNRFVEVLSESYELRTNWATFRQNVRVSEIVSNQPGGTLTCGLMTATFAGTNELQQLIALDHVIIRESADRCFKGGQAVFTSTNGILELTRQPTWQAGLREGKGEVLRVDTQRNEMLVRGNASMRLPADELGQVAPAPPGTSPKPREKAGGPQIAEIFSEEYVVGSERAVFRGGVYATHPRMNVACETLTVMAPKPDEKVLIAEQGVIFDLVSEKGDKIHGTGDKAVYTNSITSTLTNDLLTLIGSPASLATTNATNINKVIILDRAHNQLISRGDYKVFGIAPGVDTNLFSSPKKQLVK